MAGLSAIQSFFPGDMQIMKSQMPLTFELPADELMAKRNSFVEILNNTIEQIGGAEKESEHLMTQLLEGKDIDIHSIQIAGAKLDTLLTLASTVSTKLTTAYQTLMNLQV